MNWIFYRNFDDFAAVHLYEVLKLRQEVFVIEQDCIYRDLDDYDQNASHLLLMNDDRLIGYLRILPPGLKFEEVSIGRIVTPLDLRGTGTGKQLISKGLDIVFEDGAENVRIEAQHHLENYYRKFGFRTVSEPYDMDGIPHIEMVMQRDERKL